MFSSLRRLFGSISVTEQGDFVVISGLPAQVVDTAISRIWGTSKIAANMFNRITSSQLVFHKFFVTDVIYMFKVLLKDKRTRLNLQILEKVIEELYANTWAKSILNEPTTLFDRSQLDLFYKKPLPHQTDFFNVYEENKDRYQLNGFLLGADPGSGKAQPLDALLRSPDGDFPMGQAQVGMRVYNRKLKPITITGVFPQGVKAIYKVTLEDGRSTRVCLEHLWRTHIDNETEVIDTLCLLNALNEGKSVFIDLPNPLGLAQDAKVVETFRTSLDKVHIAQTYYRSLGAVTSIEQEGIFYKLYIEFRANSKIKVLSIEYDKDEPAQCISVDDSERLYVVDDYVVTHNTMTSIYISRMLKTDTNIFVVPKNALDRVWGDTFKTEFKNPTKFWISNGTEPLKLGYKDYIIHHDYVPKVLEFFDKYRKEFGEIYFNVDESHYFNEITSKRTNDVVVFARDICRSKHIVPMSGTLIKAIGSEAIPALRMLDPLFNSKVEERFIKIYGKSQTRANDILQNRMGTMTFKVKKPENRGVYVYQGHVSIDNAQEYTLDSIRAQMKAFISERMKYYKDNMKLFESQYEAILQSVASSFDTRVEKEAFEKYKKAVNSIRKNYDPVLSKEDIVFANMFEKNNILPRLPSSSREQFRDLKSIYKYYFLKVQGEALGRVLGRLRVQCNVDLLKGLDRIIIKDDKGKSSTTETIIDLIESTKKKTLMFSSFVEVVNEARDALTKAGYSPLVVYGETNKDLANIVKQFENDPKANPLIATYKSLSTAVPLTMANVTIMLNAPFRDYEFQQALARTDRLGQDSDVFCYQLYLDTGGVPNISTRSKDIMDWSKQQIQEIMGFKVNESVISTESGDAWLNNTSIESLVQALDLGVDDLIKEDTQAPINTGNAALDPVTNWMRWD